MDREPLAPCPGTTTYIWLQITSMKGGWSWKIHMLPLGDLNQESASPQLVSGDHLPHNNLCTSPLHPLLILPSIHIASDPPLYFPPFFSSRRDSGYQPSDPHGPAQCTRNSSLLPRRQQCSQGDLVGSDLDRTHPAVPTG